MIGAYQDRLVEAELPLGGLPQPLVLANLAAVQLDWVCLLPASERGAHYWALAASCDLRLLRHFGNRLEMDAQALIDFIGGQAKIEVGCVYEGLDQPGKA